MLSTEEKLEIMEKEMEVSWDEIATFLSSKSGVRLTGAGLRNNWGFTWARQKYPLFELFGGQVKISKPVENTMSDQDISNSYKQKVMQPILKTELKDLMGLVFFEIELVDLQANRLSKDYIVDGVTLKKGMKVSKALKFLIEDKGDLAEVQVAFSRFKEELEAKGALEISFDPIDILCMSYNETKSWSSCHNIFDGMYAGGPISYLVDSSTTIAQIVDSRSDNGVPNKVWRRMLMFNDELDVIAMSRAYPSSNKNNTNAVRSLLKETFGEENTAYGFVASEDIQDHFHENTDAHYNDITRGGTNKTPLVVLDREKYHITRSDAEELTMREPLKEGWFEDLNFFVGSEECSVTSASGYDIEGDTQSNDAIDGSEYGYDDDYDEDEDDYYW